MRRILQITLIPLLVCLGSCGSDEASADYNADAEVGTETTSAIVNETVEIGCASCTYSIEGAEGCSLGAKVGDKTYMVTGTKISAHDEGLCSATKSADLMGAIVDGKIAAKSCTIK